MSVYRVICETEFRMLLLDGVSFVFQDGFNAEQTSLVE
jgi:hypothetical protein